VSDAIEGKEIIKVFSDDEDEISRELYNSPSIFTGN
jgi:hypothetical protein